MLKSVTQVISKYPATTFAGVIGLLLQLIFSVAWLIAIAGMFVKLNNDMNQTKASPSNSKYGGTYALTIYMLFSMFWIVSPFLLLMLSHLTLAQSQVIQNTVHVTISGLFATYYFYGSSTGGTVTVPVSNPTAKAAKRALTTSFGTICFGSLLIAIIRTLKAMADQAGRDAAADGNMVACFFACCVSCILACIGDILEYFNHYAFTQVAIYGKDYCEAAKSTWALVKSKGIDAIINDNFIGTVLGMGAFSIALLCAGFACAVVAIIPNISKDVVVYVFAGIFAFLIGLIEFSVLAEVINSGVATTFVCLAEDPAALQRTKPELYEKIRQTYPQVQYR